MVTVESEDAWQRRLESAVSGVANALSGVEAAAGGAGSGWVRPRSKGGFEHQSAVSQAVATRIGSGAPVAAAAVASLPHHGPGDADALAEWHSRQQQQQRAPRAAAEAQSPTRRLGGIGRKEEEAYNLSVYGDAKGPREPSAEPVSSGGDVRDMDKPSPSPLGVDGPTPQQRRVAEAVRARAAAQAAGGQLGEARSVPYGPGHVGGREQHAVNLGNSAACRHCLALR